MRQSAPKWHDVLSVAPGSVRMRGSWTLLRPTEARSDENEKARTDAQPLSFK
ncbi:hypothetical protein GE21DRAFT_1202994 [Neurospora crassa]|nr:hypothetical protein GE21DRAFT_1202994 [Neurospora crassa]